MTRVRGLVLGIGLLLLIAAGTVAYSFLKEPEAASAPLESIPLEAPSAGGGDAAPIPEDALVFRIVPDESEVRFTLGETLRGKRTTVVGTTNQVAGELRLNPADLSTAQIGVIRINARTLATDEERRNRTIRNRILDTNQYEFIQFEPTAMVGLPPAVAVGEQVAFQVVGNLTIKDVTKEVTFAVTATPISETEVSGRGSTTITYSDFGVQIPSVPFVADVDEEVLLEIDFVARATN
jgi:polyisoprenoid-binding protein YceI